MTEYENCICFIIIIFLFIVFGFMVMFCHHRESFTSFPLGANSTMVFTSPQGTQGNCASNINGVNRMGERFVSNNFTYCSQGSKNHFDVL